MLDFPAAHTLEGVMVHNAIAIAPQDILARMWEIRAFEEKVSELYAARMISGLLHLGIGQEAVAVGVCSALEARDVVYAGHRAHAHALAKGASMDKLMAELAGRLTGYCRGNGGSMHISAPEVGFMTATGVVGGNIPLALGAGLVSRRRASGAISVAIFGDGAGQTGSFHESLNIASLWRLPVVLICENNGYAEFTPLSSHTLVERISRHAETYGIPSVTVDGNDVIAVREAVTTAASHARGDEGPALVECLTTRLRGHYEGDPTKYRELAQTEEWKTRDPILKFTLSLAAAGAELDVRKIESTARAKVERAAQIAIEAPWPEASDLTSHVYANGLHA